MAEGPPHIVTLEGVEEGSKEFMIEDIDFTNFRQNSTKDENPIGNSRNLIIQKVETPIDPSITLSVADTLRKNHLDEDKKQRRPFDY
jgi:hypothetical protein